ncbi:ATP-binding cassette subfamily B protein [Panacagrimonas perspica]|uniref:ATP-binding cassette subfamily B protein n=1 Tax=Panacagrimonas perspica TaxID=381431 RepID=A0A4R7PDU9_9GAMM|nr:ABC transporter ATP-binding protein [Panacagrimonas perspica]TDU31711.1 ATP-binding cassette subfamily B protein [Panacagrimonas perspica]
MDGGSLPPRAAEIPRLPATTFRFMLYSLAHYRGWYLAMLALEAVSATCGILIPYALSLIVKAISVAQQPSQAVLEALRGPILLFIGFAAAEVVFGRLTGSIQWRIGPRQRQSVTRALFHHLQHHSHRYFSDAFAGSLAHRVNEAAMGVMQTAWSVILEFWPIVIVFSVSMVLLFVRADPGLALWVGLWGIGFIAISFWLAMRCRPHALLSSAARSDTTGVIVDSVTNIASVRLFARMEHERAYLQRCQEHERIAVQRSLRYSERVRWFQFSAAAVLKSGTLIYALHLWAQDRIGLPEFVMAISLSLLIINEARNLSRRFLDFFEHVGNIANAVGAIVRPHEIVDAPDAQSWPILGGRIEFRDVDFGYGRERPVFENLSVSIAAGQRVGLVGVSGSGKSTFVNLILRLFDVRGGAVLIDGLDIRRMSQKSLHAQIGLIPQEPNLFHRSLRENIRYGRIDADADEVIDAARRAHAHEFISQMDRGYDAMVGERGVKLSGGQRQRLVIARVILKNAPVLILDEATSALDSITEKAIQETLDHAMRGKTVIVVAHRLSTIAHLDRILVFDRGRIVEDGSHAELIARRGAYHRLWSRQADGFLPDSTEDEAPMQVERSWMARPPRCAKARSTPADLLEAQHAQTSSFSSRSRAREGRTTIFARRHAMAHALPYDTTRPHFRSPQCQSNSSVDCSPATSSRRAPPMARRSISITCAISRAPTNRRTSIAC